MLKKGTVLLLTSSEAPKEIKLDGETVNTFTTGSLVFNDKASFPVKRVKTGEVVNPDMGYLKAELYLLTDPEKAKEGDLVLVGETPTILTEDSKKEVIKVIASTNRLYDIPRLSKGFLEKYTEKQGIHSVFVMYEESNEGLTPKINRSNVISLRKEKTMFTAIEVKNMMLRFSKEVHKGLNKKRTEEWMNTNL